MTIDNAKIKDLIDVDATCPGKGGCRHEVRLVNVYDQVITMVLPREQIQQLIQRHAFPLQHEHFEIEETKNELGHRRTSTKLHEHRRGRSTSTLPVKRLVDEVNTILTDVEFAPGLHRVMYVNREGYVHTADFTMEEIREIKNRILVEKLAFEKAYPFDYVI
jgi:hypothetical protein